MFSCLILQNFVYFVECPEVIRSQVIYQKEMLKNIICLLLNKVYDNWNETVNMKKSKNFDW